MPKRRDVCIRPATAHRNAFTNAITPASCRIVLPPQVARSVRCEVIGLEGISIIGNPELPKTITLVPWKRALPGDLAAQPEGSLLDEELTAIDPPVFRRELRYYEAGFAIE